MRSQLLVLALLTTGCSSSDPATPVDAGPPADPMSWSVTKVGPYACGHRELSMTYQPPGGLPSRTIPVLFWYPTNVADGDHPAYINVFTDKNAWEDAPLAASPYPAGYPILLHGHGHMGFAGNSARLMCHFASHGWVAIAPDHVGNLIGDTPETRPLSVWVHRPFDLKHALDFALGLPSSDPLSGKLDVSHLAVSGHSFGSFDAWVLGGAKTTSARVRERCDSGAIKDCTDAQVAVFETDLSEPRAKIIMPLAGASEDFMDPDGHQSARVPVLMMNGSFDDVGNDDRFARTTKLDMTWGVVEGGCHQLFGLGNSVRAEPGCAVLSDEAGFAIVNPFILAYARYQVLGDRTTEVKGLVEGTTSLSPLLKLQHKSP